MVTGSPYSVIRAEFNGGPMDIVAVLAVIVGSAVKLKVVSGKGYVALWYSLVKIILCIYNLFVVFPAIMTVARTNVSSAFIIP
jgi:hypothetical protein